MTELPNEDWPYPVSHFVCHQCGNCCRGDGFVELTDDDITRLAEKLGTDRRQFLRTHAKWEKSLKAYVLLDQEDVLKSCIFLRKDNSCRVHEAKPQQCRDFPTKWRPDNILDFCEGWRAAAGLKPAKKRTMTE